MKKTYSVYEAKAKLSAILRLVRERGETVTISHRGEPVAEIRPIERELSPDEAHIRELERRGVIVPARGTKLGLRPIAEVPGALERFLADRNE